MNVASYPWTSPWHGLRSAKDKYSWVSSSSPFQFQNGVLFLQWPRESRKQSSHCKEEGLWKLSRAGLPASGFSPRMAGKRVSPGYKENMNLWRTVLGRKVDCGIPSCLGKDTRRKCLLLPEFKQSLSECEPGQALYFLRTQEPPMQAALQSVHYPAAPFMLKMAAPSVGGR